MTENWQDPINRTVKGQYSYLWNDVCILYQIYIKLIELYKKFIINLQEADLLMSPVLPTSERLKIIDLTLPMFYDLYSLLIPVSDETFSNSEAVVKPFQWPVNNEMIEISE